MDIYKDITGHKQLKEALQSCLALLKTSLESTSDGILIVDEKGKIVCWNRNFVDMWKIPTEVLSKNDEEQAINHVLADIADPDKFVALIRQLYKRPEESSFDLVEFLDGRVFERHSRAQRIENKFVGRVWSFRDITNRKRIDEELLIRASLLDGTLDMILLRHHDPNKSFCYVNQMMCKNLGYTREELLNMTIKDIIPPEQLNDFIDRLSKMDEKGGLMFLTNWIRKDGSIFPVEANSRIIQISNKKYVLASLRDITDREATRKEQQEMEQKAQVASRLASIGEMAAGIAHEINNPLTGIICYAELLQREELPEQIRKDLKTINDGAQRVASIVRRLLTFARQTKPVRSHVHINDLITNTLNLQAYNMLNNNIEVVNQCAGELPTIIADGGQLQQVFLNLISNAVSAMQEVNGKGTLSIKTEKREYSIIVSFKDSGPGITEENMQKLFTPFFTTKEVGKGTGLGLCICYGIVAEHGGKIWAENNVGNGNSGATFFVELPILLNSEQPKLEETENDEKAETTTVKVLVVDDEEMIREFLNRILTEEGHEVDMVDNGTEALEKIQNKRYHLILLDVKMPGTSGIEVYSKIKKVAKSLTERVLFITGDVIGEDTDLFLKKTKVPFVTKPFNTIQLKKEIKRILTH